MREGERAEQEAPGRGHQPPESTNPAKFDRNFRGRPQCPLSVARFCLLKVQVYALEFIALNPSSYDRYLQKEIEKRGRLQRRLRHISFGFRDWAPGQQFHLLPLRSNASVVCRSTAPFAAYCEHQKSRSESIEIRDLSAARNSAILGAVREAKSNLLSTGSNTQRISAGSW